MDHTYTDLTSEDDHQWTSQNTSQTDIRTEDMEVLTPGMNKLPTPCWEDERIFWALVQQQLIDDEYFGRQEKILNYIWDLFGTERESLATSHTPEPEEHWTPITQEEEVLERAIPLEEDIWTSSVLAGEVWMLNVLDEDGFWPRESPEEPDIWTREDGGMLSSAALRRFLREPTLQTWREE